MINIEGVTNAISIGRLEKVFAKTQISQKLTKFVYFILDKVKKLFQTSIFPPLRWVVNFIVFCPMLRGKSPFLFMFFSFCVVCFLFFCVVCFVCLCLFFEILFQTSIFPPLRWSVYCILPWSNIEGKISLSSIKQSNALNILLYTVFSAG